MKIDENSPKSPLAVFLEQHSEGNLKKATPQLLVELNHISSTLQAHGEYGLESIRIPDASNRSDVIEFVGSTIVSCESLALSPNSSEYLPKIKNIAFHLIQIAKLLGHQPSQLALKRLVSNLASR